MSLNLIADRVIKGRIYPALARHQAVPYTQGWREFGQYWPHTVPLRLQEYCEHHGVQLDITDINSEWPANAFYSVGLSFFDFGIDYFELMPERVRTGLLFDKVRVLFYYHEGDNPGHIKARLDELCTKHNLKNNCYRFVSGNTAAQDIPGFVYFTDFELWYYQRNRTSLPLKIHHEPRERDFTVLNRLHKSWRALAMADLKNLDLLDNSYWSYCEPGVFDDAECPIEIDAIAGLRTVTEEFLRSAPYISDELDFDQRNDHSTLVPKYHANSYCNIVMETHFDVDQSGGAFLTEKTFKPIKHGQMFFVAGPAGSLQVLRDLGYRVFDSVLNNSYDLETDHTQRWMALTRSIYFAQSELPDLFDQCRDDIEHNQQLFQAVKTERLNTLIKEINESH
jgi:hypothetical protein|tara:strand:- start:2240 stop:3421 length:1182 start_codon:yes stop_codon:yes gene_type:complete